VSSSKCSTTSTLTIAEATSDRGQEAPSKVEQLVEDQRTDGGWASLSPSERAREATPYFKADAGSEFRKTNNDPL
jgi:hypothetical protein